MGDSNARPLVPETNRLDIPFFTLSFNKPFNILSISVQSMRNWRHVGRGPAYSKEGRMVRYLVQDLLDFIDSGRLDPEARQEAR